MRWRSRAQCTVHGGGLRNARPVVLSAEQPVTDVLPLHPPLAGASPAGLPDGGDQALGHLCHDRDPHGARGLLHRHHGGEPGWPEIQGCQGQYPYQKVPSTDRWSSEQSIGSHEWPCSPEWAQQEASLGICPPIGGGGPGRQVASLAGYGMPLRCAVSTRVWWAGGVAPLMV